MHALSLTTQPSEAPPAFQLAPEQPDPWSRLRERMLRRKRLFLTVFLGFVALVIVATALTPRTYTTQVKLIAGSLGGASNANANNTNLPVLNALLANNGVASAETYAELVQETPVAQKVIDALNLHMSPAALKSHITVKPITNTQILGLDVTWRDPQGSAAIGNAFAQAFVDRERDLVASEASAAVTFLQSQLPTVEQRLHNAEAALTQFQATHRIADITAQTNSAVGAVASIDSKIAQTQLDANQASAQIKSLSSQIAKLSPTTSGGGSTAPNPVVGQLQTQLAQAQVQLNAARQQYTEQHPTVIALREQVAQLQRQIASQPATIVSARLGPILAAAWQA